MVSSLKQPPPQPTNPNMRGEDHPQNCPIVEWSLPSIISISELHQTHHTTVSENFQQEKRGEK